MLTKDARLFVASFFSTLLLSAWLVLFFFVDIESARYENSPGLHAFELERPESLRLNVTLMGKEYKFTLDPLNEFEAWRKKYACLVTPRGLLALEQLYSLGVYGRDVFNEWYTNEQYIQNVAKSQEGVPIEQPET